MSERERALLLAQELDRDQQKPQTRSEPAADSDQQLINLAASLTSHSPFAPTPGERQQLRQILDQMTASLGAASRRKSPLPLLKPVAQVALWTALLVGIITVSAILIGHLLGAPAGPSPAGVGPTLTEPAIMPTSPDSAAQPETRPFPIQAHAVNGVTMELREVVVVGSSLRATLCYQPPDGKARRLEGVEIIVGETILPFYPANTTLPESAKDGLVCETFTTGYPPDSLDVSWTIIARRLVGPRETTPDCELINRQLAVEFPGLTVVCDTDGGGFGVMPGNIPDGMNDREAFQAIQTYVESDVVGGPWAFILIAKDILQPGATGVASYLVVDPTACEAIAAPAEETLPWVPLDHHARLHGTIGLGEVQSGSFAILMGLACDPSFTRLIDGGNYYTEINGLGVMWRFTYLGEAIEGETRHYSGIEPFVSESGGSGGPLQRGDSTSMYEGIAFPANIHPDFSQGNVRLRYLLKVQAPDGTIEGAALSFTLQHVQEGYRPVDVRVEPLTEAERRSVESDPYTPLPFPTLPAPETRVPAEILALLDLLETWQAPLLANPGWVHLRTHTEIPGGNALYAGLTEYINEDWYRIDEQEMVVAHIHIDRRPDGTVLQEVVNQDGKSRNLTFGMSGEYQPYPLDLAYVAKDTLKSGSQVRLVNTTLDGQPVIVLLLQGLTTRRDVISTSTGAWLYTENIRLQAGDDPLTGGSLDTRTTLQVAERVDTPPPEALALLDRVFEGYTPPEPYGTPAPPGFDPSGNTLTHHSVPGDSFDNPSFWYGDLYADGYLLGRVDFGSAPGGNFCDRSPDGSKLAFVHSTVDSAGSVTAMRLTWLDLRDLKAVHQPAPKLTNIGSLAWSPAQEALAVFGCQAGQQACGLYRLDPGTGRLRLLLPGVYTAWPLLWKGDGSQVAFVDHLKQGNVLYVVDFNTGAVIYQGVFNVDTWQAPADSPTQQWGVSFPRSMYGSRCFESN